MGKFRTWLSNAKCFHHRLMMNYLRKRGWVVFYLEENVRVCSGTTCWLQIYNSEMNRKKLDT